MPNALPDLVLKTSSPLPLILPPATLQVEAIFILSISMLGISESSLLLSEIIIAPWSSSSYSSTTSLSSSPLLSCSSPSSSSPTSSIACSQSCALWRLPLDTGWPLQLHLLWPHSRQFVQRVYFQFHTPFRIHFIRGRPACFRMIRGTTLSSVISSWMDTGGSGLE